MSTAPTYLDLEDDALHFERRMEWRLARDAWAKARAKAIALNNATMTTRCDAMLAHCDRMILEATTPCA